MSRNTAYLKEQEDVDYIDMSVKLRSGAFESRISIPTNMERSRIADIAQGWIASMKSVIDAGVADKGSGE